MIKNKIYILLSTYNGSKYLKEQLDSLFSQNYQNFKLIVRDDGSTDATKEILNSYDIELLSSSENLGVKKSFETLLKYAYENSDAQYFMFCDQDDIWENDKIEKTLLKMKEIENKFIDEAVLVHTDLQVVDESLKTINTSFWKHEQINPEYNSLNYLLMQNTVTGCTMMINRKLAELSLPISNNCMMHDWWIALVASNFGKIAYINEPTIKYRQHSSNSVGAKGFSYLIIIKKVLIKKHKISVSGNIIQAKAFLENFEEILDNRIKEMLEEFVNIENKSFFKKRFILLKYKILKQGLIRNIGLFLKI